MTKNILIVDDSEAMQSFLGQCITMVPSLKVAGTASNGSEALKLIPQLEPDIIFLDIDMPVMDGLETLEVISKQFNDIPVLMLNSQTDGDSVKTMRALAIGAKDYLSKPLNLDLTESRETFVRKQLNPKIKSVMPAVSATENIEQPKPTGSSYSPRIASSAQTKIVVIGSSLGGPEALTTVLAPIPEDFPVPILVTLHMPAAFTKKFADRLSSKIKLEAEEAYEGAPLEAGKVWIAKGDYHMQIKAQGSNLNLHLHQGPLENSCRPAIDPLFRSAVEHFGSNVLGVILTGTGYDGTQGCRIISEGGGYVVAQDERSSASWSMPGNVVKLGYSDTTASLEHISQIMLNRVNHYKLLKNNHGSIRHA